MAGQRPPRHRRTGKTKEQAIAPHHEDWYRQHMRGVDHSTIAEQAGVSRPAVSKAVTRVEQIMAAEFLQEIKKYRNRCTIRMEWLYKEAIVEWERSKLPAVTDKVGQAKASEDEEFDANGAQYFIERTTKSQVGSPALHSAARATLKELMELHGIRYVEEPGGEDEDEDIAGLTTAEQVDAEIKKHSGDIKRLTEYREMVIAMEGGASDPNNSTVATECEQVLETSDEGEIEGPAPD